MRGEGVALDFYRPGSSAENESDNSESGYQRLNARELRIAGPPRQIARETATQHVRIVDLCELDVRRL